MSGNNRHNSAGAAGAKKRPLPALTALRFFLALWVVFFHQIFDDGIQGAWIEQLPQPVWLLVKTGYCAVSVFFVLSGFVLAYNYDLGRRWPAREMARFAVARFARIYPSYALGFMLTAPLLLFGMLPQHSYSTLKLWVSGFLNIFLGQSWAPRLALTWNFPSWSLSAEAFFYLCFPVVGIYLWRAGSQRELVSAAALLWGAALLAPAAAVLLPLHGFGDEPATSLLPNANLFWVELINLNPLLRLPEFCFGIVAARLYRFWQDSGSPHIDRGYWLYVPAIVGLLLALQWADRVPYPLLHNGLLLPLFGCLVLGFALGGGPLVSLLSSRPLIVLGEASYAMYILHKPVGWWLEAAVSSGTLGFGTTWEMTALYLAVLIPASVLVFYWFEQPAARWVKQRLTSRADAWFAGRTRPSDNVLEPSVIPARPVRQLTGQL